MNDLLDLEHAGWRSLCTSTGGTFYGELMTSDAVFILVDGTVMSRDEVANSLDGAPAWEGYEITEARMLSLGTDAAALIYRASATRSDLHEPFVAMMSSTYRRVADELRLALYQQTIITH